MRWVKASKTSYVKHMYVCDFVVSRPLFVNNCIWKQWTTDYTTNIDRIECYTPYEPDWKKMSSLLVLPLIYILLLLISAFRILFSNFSNFTIEWIQKNSQICHFGLAKNNGRQVWLFSKQYSLANVIYFFLVSKEP